MAIVGELGDLLNVFACAREALEDGMEVSTWLHRNDSELIFLIDPHEESLCVIVEDTSSFGPLAVKSASLQESITLLKEEVISDHLVLNLLFHALNWVEGSLEVTLEGVDSGNNLVHDL